ncbi:MAG: aa3-type cytochrome c oxidase subunit IV [Pikeienuella sp.]
MGAYVPGEMDITQHKKTFAGFLKVGMWLFGVSAAVLIFLAIFAV